MADSSQYARYTGLGGAGGGVTSLNSLTGALTLAAGTGISITPSGGNTLTIASTSAGDLTLTNVGSTPNAQGASLSGQALTLQPANTSFPGVLLAADWNTFNNKQSAGSYITALTGDVTASGPGSVAATSAATQNNITSIPNLATVGTITSGTWSGTTIAINKGGTGQITAAAAFNALSPITTTGDMIYSPSGATSQRLAIGSTGNVLTVASGVPTWAPPATAGTVTAVSVASANGFAGSSSGGATPALTLSTSITGILQGNGTAISAISSTGTGNVVLASSPTLITPALGTPSALVGTNISGTGASFTAGTATNIAGGLGGSIPYQTAVNTTALLANGSSGQVLTSNGTTLAPSWAPIVATGSFNTIGYVYQAKTANYNAVAGDIVNCGTASAFTVTLPTAIGISGKIITVNLTGVSLISIATTSGQTIGPYSTGVIQLGTQGDSVTVYSDGANWQLIALNISVVTSIKTLSSTTITSNTNIVLSTVVFDNLSSYNTSTGIYTAPLSGKYSISFSPSYVVVGSADDASIFVNGTQAAQQFMGANNLVRASGTAYVSVSQGDTISVRFSSNNVFGDTVGSIFFSRIGS